MHQDHHIALQIKKCIKKNCTKVEPYISACIRAGFYWIQKIKHTKEMQNISKLFHKIYHTYQHQQQVGTIHMTVSFQNHPMKILFCQDSEAQYSSANMHRSTK